MFDLLTIYGRGFAIGFLAPLGLFVPLWLYQHIRRDVRTALKIPGDS